MSNPNFVSDLVAMAKAFEELPQVKQALFQQQNANTDLLDQIQRLELQLRDSHNETQNALSTIRKVEAERDDAELRFLESVDRTASALAFIKSTFGSAGSLIQALEPPAPVAVVVPADAPVAVNEVAQAEIQRDAAQGDKLENIISGYPYGADAPTQGQSEQGPTVSSTATDGSQSNTVSPSSTAESTIDVPTPSIDPGPMHIDFHGDPRYPDSVSSGPAGERAVDPTGDQATGTILPNESGEKATLTEPVVDDVGYHNEPKVDHDWTAWNGWVQRMNNRYGPGTWPKRS